MFHDFKIGEGDPATNSLTATMVTQLTEAEEAHWRGMLADAWDEGYRARDLDGLVIPHGFETANPYRAD